ncbi:hypothetical protein NHH73_03765 [Oxalobacteraceae bacterium OTU3CINTB1]|nr:hypothetical protein NHH73_03765 [Oxalobacteraceae bacterium OTU3CINTB1]
MPNVIGSNTQAALSDFSNYLSSGTGSAAYQSMYNAIASSPELAFNIEQDLQLGVLRGFKPISDAGVGGQYRSGYIEMPIDAATGALRHADNLVFVLGHEDRHALAAKTSQDALDNFVRAATNLAAVAGTHDYTAILLTLQTRYAQDEAMANIAGWNSIVSQVNSNVSQPSTVDYRAAAGGYADYFVTAGGASVNSELAFNADYSISSTEASITAEANEYFYNSKTQLGPQKISYPTWYILNNLKYILQVAPTDTVQIDMQALRVDGLKIKAANLLQLTADQSYKFYDPVAHYEYVLSGTESGTTLTESHPIVFAEGEATETREYDEADSLDSVSHSWQKADGSHGGDVTDAEGNYSEFSADAAGTSSWSFKRADGAYGSGYRGANGDHSESHNPDGTFTVNSNNLVTGERDSSYKYADGSYGDNQYYANGSSHDYSHRSDGSYTESYVYADGSESFISETSDGSRNESHRYADGSTAYTNSRPDGYYVNSVNHADGSNYYKSISSAGDKSIVENDSDGANHRSYENADGSYGYADTLADGTFDQYDHRADGSSYLLSKDSSGTVTKNVDDGAGHFKSDLVYEDGSQDKEETFADGTTHAAHIDPAGDSTLVDNFDPKTGRYHFDVANKVTTTIWTALDGSDSGTVVDDNDGSVINFSTTVDGKYTSHEVDLDGTLIDIESDLTGYQSTNIQRTDGTVKTDVLRGDGSYSHEWADPAKGDFTINDYYAPNGNIAINSYIGGIYNAHQIWYDERGQDTFDCTTSENGDMYVHITSHHTGSGNSGYDVVFTGSVGGRFHEVGTNNGTEIDTWMDGPVAGPTIPVVFMGLAPTATPFI